MLPLKMLIEKYKDVVKRMLENYRDVDKTSGLKGRVKSVVLERQDKALKPEVFAKSLIDIEEKVSFYKHPFVCNWSPILLDSSKVNLYKLDSNPSQPASLLLAWSSIPMSLLQTLTLTGLAPSKSTSSRMPLHTAWRREFSRKHWIKKGASLAPSK